MAGTGKCPCGQGAGGRGGWQRKSERVGVTHHTYDHHQKQQQQQHHQNNNNQFIDQSISKRTANRPLSFVIFIPSSCKLVVAGMARTGATPLTESLNLSDPATGSEDLFASPSRTTKQKPHQKPHPEPSNPNTAGVSSREPPDLADLDSEQAHEAALRRELAGIRSVNEVIEGVVKSLEQAKGNMDVGLIILG